MLTTLSNTRNRWLPILFAVCFAATVPHPLVRAQSILPFQGRLVDNTGKPVADGVHLLQFQIFSETTLGTLLWAGELHRATINGGLVNVILGTKNPLPKDRVDQPNKSFFDQPLFLQITIDATNDNQITPADAPHLPRQSVLPVFFATESALNRDSQKLAGYDWSALFGANNPSGKIDGSRLVNITSNAIAPRTINGSLIAPQTINSGLLSPGTVDSASLANGSVTFQKLEPRQTNTNSVRAGGVAVSQIVNDASNGPKPGLTVSIFTTGRPVLVMFSGKGVPGDSSSFIRRLGNVTSQVTIYRNGVQIVNYYYSESQGAALNLPGSAWSHLDLDGEPGRQHTYTVQTDSVELHNVRLATFEL